MFRKLYNKVLVWSKHKYAVKFLMGLSFAEASFFPIPPDVMLGPMTFAKPTYAWRYATITTIFSVLGGIFGYLLGLCAYHTVVIPLLGILGKEAAYQTALHWFDLWGIWVVLVAAFTPVPFKLFTIGAGAMQMNFPAFILTCIIGRAMRFFLVCSIFKMGDKYLHDWINKWVNVLGWLLVFSIIAFYIIFLH